MNKYQSTQALINSDEYHRFKAKIAKKSATFIDDYLKDDATDDEQLYCITMMFTMFLQGTIKVTTQEDKEAYEKLAEFCKEIIMDAF